MAVPALEKQIFVEIYVDEIFLSIDENESLLRNNDKFQSFKEKIFHPYLESNPRPSLLEVSAFEHACSKGLSSFFTVSDAGGEKARNSSPPN